MGSLCKLYFRELPNPLLTYQLYTRFSVVHSFPLCSVDTQPGIFEAVEWSLDPLHVALQQDAVSAPSHEEKLIKIHDVIQQLPPPHYRYVFPSGHHHRN